MNTPQNDRDKEVLTRKEAAQFTGFSEVWLKKMAAQGSTARVKAPVYIKIGRSVRYRRADLVQWLEQHAVRR